MIDELNAAIETYHTKWHKLVTDRQDKAFFEGLKPTAIGWKVIDRAEFEARYEELLDLCDQVHLGWINNRWLATMHLKGAPLDSGIEIIKLMERRPDSTDPVGLDHLDFLLPRNADAKTVLANKPDLKWTEEKNGDNCKWLSVWFDGTEAKLRSDTVLQVCVDELLEVQQSLLDESS